MVGNTVISPDDKDRQRNQYANAWIAHIDELALLALQAGIHYNDYRDIKETLYRWIDQAIHRKEREHGK